MLDPRPNMKTVAQAAGVSVMTVSLALRNHPRISRATRTKIHELARKLGYRSNPMVASLMTQIRSSRSVSYQANIAFLAANSQPWKNHHFSVAAYEGIVERAKEMGFLVDVFAMEEGGQRGHLEKVLESRSIQGVIVAPMKVIGNLDHIDWSQWSSVALGNSLASPRIHRATHHQFHGMSTILENLTRLGYRRIGLALEGEIDDKVDRNWTACVAGYQQRIPAAERVPAFLAQLRLDRLRAWIKKYRPDVVIGHDGLLICLQRLGLRVPDDIAFASVSVSPKNPTHSGLNQNWRLVGEAAVDAVVAQIYHNERGVPENPRTIMLEGVWHDGGTTPKR